MFNALRYVHGWPPCTGGMGDDSEFDYSDATIPGDPTTYEVAGWVRTSLVAADKPRRIVKRWNWVLPGDGTIDVLPLLLDQEGVVTLTITKSGQVDAETRSRVHVVHEGAPGAWVDDLEKLWRWHVAQGIAS